MKPKSHLRFRALGYIRALVCLIVLMVAMHHTALAQSASQTSGETSASQTNASEPAPKGAAGGQKGEGEESPWKMVWELANFALIVAAVWYASIKFIGPSLQRRGAGIREDMDKSAQAMHDATQRLSTIESKLARLGEEIESLRKTASQEAAQERSRIEELGKQEAKKIAVAAEQEIASATKAARLELKVYTAELAVQLAASKLRESLSPESERRIFHAFVDDLTNGGGRTGKHGETHRENGPPQSADKGA